MCGQNLDSDIFQYGRRTGHERDRERIMSQVGIYIDDIFYLFDLENFRCYTYMGHEQCSKAYFVENPEFNKYLLLR